MTSSCRVSGNRRSGNINATGNNSSSRSSSDVVVGNVRCFVSQVMPRIL